MIRNLRTHAKAHHIQDCLINRHELGAAIDELSLKTCYELPEGTVTLLKGMVANVGIVDDPEQEQDTRGLSDSDTEEETEGEED